MRSVTRVGAAGIALVLAISLLSMGAVAGGQSADVTQISSIDFTVEDRHASIEDVELSGPGLPSIDIDERTFELDSAEIQTDGFLVEFGETTYEICSVDIQFDDVTLTVSDVSINA
ncbi:hypothetical protein [Natronococcus occultus]|uniref:Uncharacterized protein n=1 Tax=Natronococcus occultus SP4 TaxID=694430 RepID=L0K3R9_9EURY|nr:hypothetical protein [Natronococcus occultus]AGB38748.1 hypothetical protein Natoc_2994 [Natronococcus occultus SP4]